MKISDPNESNKRLTESTLKLDKALLTQGKNIFDKSEVNLSELSSNEDKISMNKNQNLTLKEKLIIEK